MKWNATHNGENLPTKNGQYLITIKSTANGEVSRFTTVAEFRKLFRIKRWNSFGADSGNSYSWTWSDGCGENVWAYCFHKWEHDGDVYIEEITAWAEMSEPYEES